MTAPTSKWNFCPECGHQIFLHNADGCTHAEILESYVIVVNELGKDERQRVTDEIPCYCKMGHPLIVAARSAQTGEEMRKVLVDGEY